ncbi:WXG100 family type VII secretion target [Saccharothrix longispora]|uniref:ESAT-6-like protein n=1 Tax=Saccharothrix longispora TaxID=33920 RepID=A0ABU1PS36_9PSEU|nr:WXG100 family type VII secretion target [Saccharothrix longispora]MDR6593455.1 WXG100 family type VII secretion target [Saccharothrix longispora]
MTNYTFDQRMADQARDQMAEVSVQLRNMLGQLNQELGTALQDWRGEARLAYEAAQKKWNAAADRMPSSLHSAEVALQNITNGYLRVEHTGVNAFGAHNTR